MRIGIDISTWQKGINYEEMKTDPNVDFVILRSSFRKIADNRFSEHVAGCRRVGIPIYGTYHFSYATSVKEAADEARFAVEMAKKEKLDPSETVIFYDFEYDTVNNAKKKGVTLKPSDCQAFTEAFLDIIEEAGYLPGVYYNQDYYVNWYGKNFLSNRRWYLWLADYTGGPSYPCDIQQYSSTGKVKGIAGNIDMNYWFNDPLSYYTSSTRNDIYRAAVDVINGEYGNGADRKKNLEQSGFNYSEVQTMVNSILSGTIRNPDDDEDSPPNRDNTVALVECYNHDYVGLYRTTEEVNLRRGAGTDKISICKMPKGVYVTCYGMYTPFKGHHWLYVMGTPFDNGIVYSGFVDVDYVKEFGK